MHTTAKKKKKRKVAFVVEKWLVVVFQGITGSLSVRDSQACVHRFFLFFLT